MKSHVSSIALALMLAVPAAAQTDGAPPPSEGPQGSSQPAPGQERYDEVGYAGTGEGTGMTAAHRSLPAGTFVEVTALDSGKTIIVTTVAGDAIASGELIQLSPDAATALGDGEGYFPVRVRLMTPSPQDQAALRTGGAAVERIDAPPALLAALRKRLAAVPKAAATPVRTAHRSTPRTPAASAEPRLAIGADFDRPGAATPPVRINEDERAAAPAPAAPRPTRARAPAVTGRGYFVQVAALSDAGRARGLANMLGGFVKPDGGLYRVQIGPFPDNAAAGRARATAARRGYPDARIFTQ